MEEEVEKDTKKEDVDTGEMINSKTIKLDEYDSNITIEEGGEYNIEGTFNHSILVDSSDKVILNLNNVSINSDITAAIGNIAKQNLSALISIMALITINLGLFNLLPLPALDGGRLITVLFEMITKKRVPPKVEGMINAIGLALLLGLSLVIMVKDVIQLII